METQDYLVGFPVWIVALNPRFDSEAGKLSFDGLGVIYNENSACVAIFTEELFAERFIGRAEIHDAEPVRFDDPRELATLLDEQRRRFACQYVAFDPQSLTREWPALAIGQFIEVLNRNRLDEH